MGAKNEQKFQYKGYNVTQTQTREGDRVYYAYSIGNQTCTNIKELEIMVARLNNLKAGAPIMPTKVHKDKKKYTRKAKHKTREEE